MGFSWLIWLLIVIYLFYKYLSWNYDYWYKRGVPYLKGTPPFGNIREIFFHRKIIGQLYREIYNKFDGSPWCGFFKMGTPILLVRDPELIKQVLIKDFNNFQENDFHFNPQADPIFAMNPFAVSGQRWKDMRAVLAPAQTPGKVRTVIPCTLKVANNMIEYVNESLNQKIEMLEFFGHFTTDLTSAWGLGLDINSFKNPGSDMRVNATNMFGGDFKTNMAILMGFYTPTIGNFLGWGTMRKQFVDFFSKLVINILDERQNSTVKKNDLVDMLFDIARDSISKNKRLIDFKEVTGHVLTFFSEGYLTSSFTLTCIFHELAKNPEIQDRAREEVQSVIGSVDQIDYEKLQTLTYLNQVIDETLRLYPIVPTMTRVCTKKTVLSSGGKELTIEPGTPVAISILGVHYDNKYYENPKLFDPERFSDEQKQMRDRILYLGFSDGPRACVGSRFAMTNIKICMASILLNFRILPTEEISDFTIDPSCSFLMMPKNAYIKFDKL